MMIRYKRSILSVITLLLIGCAESSPQNETNSTVTSDAESFEYVRNEVIGLGENDGSVTFRSFADVLEENKLNDGTVVQKTDWPGVLDTAGCTGALIGPNTVLTAAHCVDASKSNTEGDPRGQHSTVDSYFIWFGRYIKLKCDMNPLYSQSPHQNGGLRNLNDHALCHLEGSSPKIEEANGVITNQSLYERIDVSGDLNNNGDDVTLAGFGCYNYRPFLQEDRYNQGRYFYNINWRRDMTTNNARRLRVGSDQVEKTTNNVSIITHSLGASAEPSVCPGDSGGPMFSGTHNLSPGDGGARRVIGVNSTIGLDSVYRRGDLNNPVDYRLESTIAGLSNSGFISFLEAWATKHNTKVCISGYNGAKNVASNDTLCRQ